MMLDDGLKKVKKCSCSSCLQGYPWDFMGKMQSIMQLVLLVSVEALVNTKKKNFHLHCNLHYLAYSLYILNLPNYKTVFVIIPCCFNTA